MLSILSLSFGCHLQGPNRRPSTEISASDHSVVKLIHKDFHFYIAVTIEHKKPVLFLLDTGANISIVTKKGYDFLLAAGAKKDEEGFLDVGQLSIAGQKLTHVQFAQNKTPEGFLDEYGVIGLESLSQFKVGLDLKNSTLRLWPATEKVDDVVRQWYGAGPNGKGPLPEITTTPAHISDDDGWGRMRVQVGNLNVDMLLDTGAALTVVDRSTMSQISDARPNGSYSATLFDGIHNVSNFRLPGIHIGPLSISDPLVGSSNLPLGLGILGLNVTQNFKILLDYPAGLAYFAPNPLTPTLGKNPYMGGPQSPHPDGSTLRWKRGEAAHIDPGFAYFNPPGYTEKFNADDSVDLIPDPNKLKQSPTDGDAYIPGQPMLPMPIAYGAKLPVKGYSIPRGTTLTGPAAYTVLAPNGSLGFSTIHRAGPHPTDTIVPNKTLR